MPPQRDRVAVITRTRDRPLLLRRAIASVLAQSHADWCHCIVNDGGDSAPVDQLVAEHESAFGGRVRVLHHAVSTGMEAASNAAIAATESDYVVIHDDDDAWHPDFLARTLAALHAHARALPECRGAIAWSEVVEERIVEGTVETILRRPFNVGLTEVRLWRLLASNQFPPISFLFAREAAAEIGGFDPTLPVLGDWDFNLRFCARFEIAVQPEVLAFWHHRENGTEAAYGNTVVQGAALHTAWRAILMNRWLRADLAAGRVGIGVLAALAEDTAVQSRAMADAIARAPRAWAAGLPGVPAVWRKLARR